MNNRIFLKVISWLLILCAPICILSHLTPLIVQIASLFTIAGIILDWLVTNKNLGGSKSNNSDFATEE